MSEAFLFLFLAIITGVCPPLGFFLWLIVLIGKH